MSNLKEKVVIITGAASGMGKAQAIAFARGGAQVIAIDINESGLRRLETEIKSSGGKIYWKLVDITNKEDIQKCIDDAALRFGRIDVLSNTAGIFDGKADSLNITEEVWDKVMAVDVKANYLLSNAVLPYMIKQGKGSIINVASIAGLVAGAGGAAYTAAKHAVLGYTKQLSFNYASKGIKVNAICPGIIRTPMNEPMLNDPASLIQQRLLETPAGRYGEAEEVAKLALFLAGEDSDFIHGAAIPIDGGSIIG